MNKKQLQYRDLDHLKHIVSMLESVRKEDVKRFREVLIDNNIPFKEMDINGGTILIDAKEMPSGISISEIMNKRKDNYSVTEKALGITNL